MPSLTLICLLVGLTKAQIIRDVRTAGAAPYCSVPRTVMCGELCREMFRQLATSGDIRPGMGTRFISTAPVQMRACLWRQRDRLKRGLWMNDCIHERLVRLNQEHIGEVIPFEVFTSIEKSCPAEPRRSSDCQIHRWYVEVLERNIGKTIESIGLVRYTHASLQWRDIVTLAIGGVSRKRPLEETPVVITDDDYRFLSIVTDETDDWVDTLTETFSEPLPSTIMPRGLLGSAAARCYKQVFSHCRNQYRMGLVLWKTEPDMSIDEVIRRIEPEASLVHCTEDALRDFRSALTITEAELERFIILHNKGEFLTATQFANAMGVPVYKKAICELHAWYSAVMNPRIGQLTITDLNIGVVTQGSGERRSFLPPKESLQFLLDLEISRLQPF
jgi:hypothetical protein